MKKKLGDVTSVAPWTALNLDGWQNKAKKPSTELTLIFLINILGNNIEDKETILLSKALKTNNTLTSLCLTCKTKTG